VCGTFSVVDLEWTQHSRARL